ncbi:MAG: hypothetical protein ACE5ID_03055 [Acidobacteriota bacterium]
MTRRRGLPAAGRFLSLTAAAGLVAAPGQQARAAISVAGSCLPDWVAVWAAAGPSPGSRFGAGQLPGIVLGPPGNSSATTGSVSVASLGHGGSVTVEFRTSIIEDRPGPDFIIFENAFFIGAVPATPQDDFFIFAEPARVEVSPDGLSWFPFPFDPAALAAARGRPVDRTRFPALHGLAGLTPTFTGDWTIPDDPTVWDPAGTGGISGAGGDAFDLADAGLAAARFVRITDADSRNGPPGSADGFDLDAVVILNGRPAPAPGADSDADGLGDLEEAVLYGTLPGQADTDGDGQDDGREVAGCRAPDIPGKGAGPVVPQEPRLWLQGEACTQLNWTFMGSGRPAHLLRGHLAALSAAAGAVDLGPTTCLATGVAQVTWSCDADLPDPSTSFFYLVQSDSSGLLGRSSLLLPRQTGSSCP